MRVILYAADDGGCAYVRCHEPLRTSGVDGEVRMSVMVTHIPYRGGVRGEVLPVDADVVVFSRPPHQDTPGMIEQFQAQGVAVVVDVDDDFPAIHPENGAYAMYTGQLSPALHGRNIARCCGLADLVTVSTPALADRYGAHGRVQVLPNAVPEKILDYPSLSDGHTLGWPGRVASHPGDLETTHGGVGEALDGDWRFHVIGEAAGVREKLRLPSEPTETPWIASVEDYHRELCRLTVGIVPLCDSKFNAAKSWLKGIELAGAGVPFVASPRAEYAALGLGLLVPDRARSWRRVLRDLLGDESLRLEMAEQGREVIRAEHTFERTGPRWAEAWNQAVTNRHARTLVAA